LWLFTFLVYVLVAYCLHEGVSRFYEFNDFLNIVGYFANEIIAQVWQYKLLINKILKAKRQIIAGETFVNV